MPFTNSTTPPKVETQPNRIDCVCAAYWQNHVQEPQIFVKESEFFDNDGSSELSLLDIQSEERDGKVGYG